tara:strand:- start:115 stop:2301 length:2187 start_codon:yes stop_codon:yes gene_type:complete
MADQIVGIKISSLGLPGSTLSDDRLRWVQIIPTGVSDEVRPHYIKCLTSYPAAIATEINIRRGQSQIGGTGFTLNAIPDVTQRFFSDPVSIGRLGSALSIVSTSVTILDLFGNPRTDRDNTHIISERECIQLLTQTAPGVYDCVRGVAGTVAQPHGILPTQDSTLFPAEIGPSLIGREVVVFRMPANGDETTEEVIWRGALTNPDAPTPSVVQLTCDDILSVIGRRRLLVNRFKQRLRFNRSIGLNGIRQTFDEDPPLADENDRSLFCVAGQTVVEATRTGTTLREWNWGGLFDSTTGRTGIGGSPNWIELGTATPTDAEAWECYTTNAALQPEIDGNTLPANPLELILLVLTTTVGGGNGSYDIGNFQKPWVGEQMGLGFPTDAVDVEGIENLAKALPTSQLYPNLWIGLDPEPIDVLPWIQGLLKPLAAILTVGKQGRLTVAKLADTPDLDATSLTRADFHATPLRQSRRYSEPFEKIEAIYGEIPGRGVSKEKLLDVVNLQRQTDGGADIETLEVRGLRDRTEAQNLASQLIAAFHDPPRIVALSTNRTKDFPVGSVQRLSHTALYNADGSRGVSGIAAFVESYTPDLQSGRITYKFRLTAGRRGRVAPSAKVSGIAGPVHTVEKNEYTTDGGPFEEDTDGFQAGDLVRIIQPDFTIRDAGPYTIVTVSSGSITLSAVTTAVIGDIIESVPYDNPPTANQTDKWSYIGDSTTRLIDGDDPYEWSV